MLCTYSLVFGYTGFLIMYVYRTLNLSPNPRVRKLEATVRSKCDGHCAWSQTVYFSLIFSSDQHENEQRDEFAGEQGHHVAGAPAGQHPGTVGHQFLLQEIGPR